MSSPHKIKRGFEGLFCSILTRVIHLILARPRLKALALYWLHLYPPLETKLFCLNIKHRLNTETSTRSPEELSSLTPRARLIYLELKAAIEQNKRGSQ